MNIEYMRPAIVLVLPFLLAIGTGSDRVQANAGMNKTEAVRVDSFLITSLAESGRASAQLLLGEMRLTGNGIPRDYAEALKWFRAAAEQGDAQALRRLGFMYESGLGVKRDLAQAELWYDRAVECGDLLSSYRQGSSYMGMNIP